MKFTFEGFFILLKNRHLIAETGKILPLPAGMRICDFKSAFKSAAFLHYRLPAGRLLITRRKPLLVDIPYGKDVVQ